MSNSSMLLGERAASADQTSCAVSIDVSIVIVNWNSCDLLNNCLASLASGGMDGIENAEIWVVDNASSDGCADTIRASYPAVQLVENTENIGFARACNQAIRQASGRYLLLLNPDTIVPPGALAGLVRALDTRSRAAACAPLLLNMDGTPQPCWARFPNTQSELTGQLDRSQSPYPLAAFDDPLSRAALPPFAVDWAGGACLLVRSEAIREAGLLDESFFLYAEETDWCRRFRGAGWSVLVVPAVSVVHHGSGSSRLIPDSIIRTRRLKSMLRYYRLSYGFTGALLPSLAALARHGFSRLRHGDR